MQKNAQGKFDVERQKNICEPKKVSLRDEKFYGWQ